ncbi:MAG TPA: Ig-like domain-containing protein, partial [Phototrophicaceae bacterium]|nr:Ig-like domain-containing protein [Phototrophicaceae bacterium]
MKRVLFFLICALLLVPVALMQDVPALRVEITGVNASELPTIVINAAVFDRLGQPILGLTADNFSISGSLAESASVVSVENITDDQLAFSVVLAIDTSSSMSELPLQRAKEAAAQFIGAIGPNDPVAILTFDSQIQLVQDFSTDKQVLLDAIASLQSGGKTALYKGVLEAVDKAALSPTPRRAVIVLSDGAEYGDLSQVERGAAAAEAVAKGVPVYTIGVGFGYDRTYLEEISNNTSAQFNESPNPDQLLGIYDTLAATLRSQYIVTINADVPADGTEYGLTLNVNRDGSTASADTTVRAPILVPVVSLPDLPTEPITEPVTVTDDVRTDDPLTVAQFRLDGVVVATPAEPPFSIVLDPQKLHPGPHRLTFSAADATGGGTAQVTGNFEVAALPSEVTIVGLGTEPVAEPLTVTLAVTGQTPAASASFKLDEGEASASAAPFNFTIDPAALTPGEHTLSVEITNEGGITTSVSQPFTVAALPPQISISGLESGQTVAEPVAITVDATGQAAVKRVSITVNGQEIAAETAVPVTVTLNPADLAPGASQVAATVILENDQLGTAAVDFEIAALPPTLTITGLEAGETLDANRTVTAEAGGQTAITGVTFALDGAEAATEATAPYTFEIDVLATAPGEHTLAVTATNAGGKSAGVTISFTVSDAPSLTATGNAKPTDVPAPT